jgi:hypothetical protein
VGKPAAPIEQAPPVQPPTKTPEEEEEAARAAANASRLSAFVPPPRAQPAPLPVQPEPITGMVCCVCNKDVGTKYYVRGK